MKTFLFEEVIFGPLKSRRLGISLGVNLLPVNRKYCNFDCIYCECGFNENEKGLSVELPTREIVFKRLDARLSEMSKNQAALDVITFAGNGEPTMHPQFKSIIEDTLLLRNKYFPEALVSVLSNATMLHKSEVRETLKRVDQNILKLDSGIAETINLIDKPTGIFDIQNVVRQLKSFQGNVIIQTMFLKGIIDGQLVDNTTEEEVSAWQGLIAAIKPRKVMIYTIDRNTPFDDLEKIPQETLKQIATKIRLLGIEVMVAE